MMQPHKMAISEIRGADPVAVTEAYLDRIARHNDVLRAFTALDIDGARAAAAESAVHKRHGIIRPLEGVPIGIKANIDIEGLATTAGVAARRDMIATADASVVKRLRDAGAIILGHLNMDEAALGAMTDNNAYGRTENPHRIGHTPGGSSGGGGAAVAAGLCCVALGTDTLGSVRIPAAYSGVYGLKPTNGLIDDAGLVPLAPRLDCIGALARSVADLGALVAVLVPLGAAMPASRVATLRSVDEALREPAVQAGFAAAQSALAAMGLRVIEAMTPDLDLVATRMGGFIESVREAAGTFATERAAGGISATSKGLMDFALAVAPGKRASFAAAMAHAAATLHRVLEDVDVLLLPTTPQAAFPHGAPPSTQADFTALANVAGLPALSLPSGWSAEGLPVGVQLVGRAGSEATLLALAARLDEALGAYRWPRDYP